MTTPGRATAARLLCSLEPPGWFLRHACAVADIAGFLARRTAARGMPVDVPLVEAAALLHDVDKLPTARVPGLRHGEGSAAWLTTHGMPELAPVVRDHPVTRLAEPPFADWVADAPTEARIVAYADKRAGQRLEPMSARFASWRGRYPSGPGEHVATRVAEAATGDGWGDEVARLVWSRAQALEGRVCAAAGVRPEEVRRLRWSRRALAAAVQPNAGDAGDAPGARHRRVDAA